VNAIYGLLSTHVVVLPYSQSLMMSFVPRKWYRMNSIRISVAGITAREILHFSLIGSRQANHNRSAATCVLPSARKLQSAIAAALS
jgi:hypothetical protein